MQLTNNDILKFQNYIWSFYEQEGRDFPWRNIKDPYKVVVSEIMLQQTQTYRVIPKYEQFITTFSSFASLSQATLCEVLSVWQGLGYNRRGKYLHELACIVMHEYKGILPSTPEQLWMLPGIGPATAASIAAFAFNMPTVFIETNIRTVFITHFFSTKDNVYDKELMPIIAQTLDRSNPREWYYALMDYGVMLKQRMVNPNRKSAHYTRQSKFDGSDRQLRGKIIKLLTDTKAATFEELHAYVLCEKSRLEAILDKLMKDQLIQQRNHTFLI